MFRTELIIAPAAQQLSAAARVLTLGSCFADSMGARLAADKVNVLVNPFGTVFQPLAAGRLLRAALGEDVDWQQHLVEARGRWQSYDLHGSQGAPTPVELLHDIQQTVRRTGEFLRGADAVLLTLGTAWAYRLRETGELVNNCHKMPAELFEKVLLTPDEIINALAETHAYLRRVNPKLRIILTVSPVRHLRDTLPLNAVSKSVLRVACHYLSELLPDVSYFPAFELLTDDLRDYRFYAADMLHPSEVAEDYVWEKFARAYFDADFGRFRKEWTGLRQALGHRPLNAAAPEHRQFLENTRERLEQLGRQRVNVAAELREVSERLATLPVPTTPAFGQAVPDEEERIDVGTKTAAAGATERPADTPATTGERAPRLSPEEFRAQRAARNNDRNGRNRRNADQQMPVEEPIAPAAPPVPYPAESVEAAAPVAGQAALFAADGTETDPSKKKKRRSRGGAKRTARKNAARLATTEAEEGAENPVADAELAAPAEEVAAAPRNPQPEPQKSSVITKSVPVKRGGRDRGRNTEKAAAQPHAAAAEGAPAAESAPGSATTLPAAAGQPVSGAPLAAEALVPAAPEPSGNRNRDDRRQQPKARPLFATPAAAAPPAAPAARPEYEARPKPGPTLAELLAPPLVRPTGPVAGRMRGATATLVTSTLAAKAAKPTAKATKPAVEEAKPTAKANKPAAKTAEPAAKATVKPAKPAAKAATPTTKAAGPVAKPAKPTAKAGATKKAEVAPAPAVEARKAPASRRTAAKPAVAAPAAKPAPAAPAAAQQPAKPRATRAKKAAAPPDAGPDSDLSA
ncbi:GSCFA domain-containing protein [Hymenobacter caeli]|uniref:GSCFA domain-containing protein n=1 Tax=Hymenobacter caeli TaxID=2735894 RepID=A0ABX2FPH6_9BACT|nr:GSCFA domain-containing protein [Hymenobacter caeli]NRT19077.1 hypothetical protein [Hymenobacter caeli]